MAAMTTASLVSLYEPDEDVARPMFAERFGIAPNITALNAFGLSTSAFLSISFLVFLNAAQSFVLTELLGIPASMVGEKTGSLLLADELLSLFVVLLWGVLCDLHGIQYITVMGHWLVALGLLSFVNSSTFGLLICARLVYALGASALLTSLTAGIALFTPLPPAPPAVVTTPAAQIAQDSRNADPIDVLLLPVAREAPVMRDVESSEIAQAKPEVVTSGSFVGIIGAIAGCGALVAVFGYLRLPNLFATFFEGPDAAQLGLRYAFYFVATLAITEGLFLLFSLRMKPPPIPILSPLGHTQEEEAKMPLAERFKEIMSDLAIGFQLAYRERIVLLAFAAGFATRAQSIVTAAFVPLLVNKYFLEHDLPTRGAFVLSSAITGVIQTVSLLACLPLGYLASRLPTAMVLACSITLGATAFGGFGLFATNDPRVLGMWLPCAVMMGVSQAAGLVLSLGLVAQARSQVVAKEKREVGGAISGVYAFSGGVGILFVGKLGGVLFDMNSGFPFLLMSGIDLIVAAFAVFVYVASRRSGGVKLE